MLNRPQNLVRNNKRYVIARNRWSALYMVDKVRKGFAPEKKILHLTRDDALSIRNKMRSIHHATYQVFEVIYDKKE